MIEFEHKLPAMNIDGRQNGTYNNVELAIPGCLTTLDPRLGKFIHALRKTIYSERALVFIDGRVLMCNKNWIRDHVHVMKGSLHFEYDLTSFLDFIIETAREDGQYFELIKQLDDRHWAMVDEDCRVIYEEDNLALVRLELEADIEYLVVEGALYNYRVTGDNAWLARILPTLERGIDYITSDKKRWSRKHGLVMRPFTIDTWDFTDDNGNKTQHQSDRRIHENEAMSIMHGDNSGVFAAMRTLAYFNRKLGKEAKAADWEMRAEALRENMIRHLWNGRFFIHQLHLGHSGLDDKEEMRLSLSNTYDINRGVTDTKQSRAIIEEYMARRRLTDKFAEWFTIDPPYECFLGYRDGEYVNGAISPFTAGELARAAFHNGYEEYGWDILSRFMRLIERDGTSYFLYSPDSSPQPERGPSTWGAAALLCAIDEGLAGVTDLDSGYREILFTPAFPVTPYTELRYITGYEKSGCIVDIRYILKEDGMRYRVISPAHTLHAKLLLPKGKECRTVLVNGTPAPFSCETIGASHYVKLELSPIGCADMEVIFQPN